MVLRWRITKAWQKFLFVVIGYVGLAALLFAIRTWLLPIGSLPYILLSVVLSVAFPLLGVRTFRGYLEPVEPPRAWWRWTGRPAAGCWLGGLAILALLGGLRDYWPEGAVPANYPAAVLYSVQMAFIAGGYLNSSFRLLRHRDQWSQTKWQARADLTEAGKSVPEN